LREAAGRAVAPLLSPIYSGIGSVLFFHRVVAPPGIPRSGWPSSVETEPHVFESILAQLARSGHSFVSIDELREVLVSRRGRARKLVVITFDDGYADVLHTALPLLASRNVPFVLYLTTGFPDRTVVPFWYPLERALAAGPRLTLSLRGEERSYPAATAAEREASFEAIHAIFQAADLGEHRALAEEAFGAAVIARAEEELFLTWEGVARLAAHPLVTLGAHTVSHPVLQRLSPEAARREILESRLRLEAKLGRPVRHFAYPYGQPEQASAREYELARECGFETAVTTCLTNVFPGSARCLHALPRLPGEEPGRLELWMTGVPSAFLYRGRRVVTA
jgi:peptidoglycan/xylan/chitin deacetylase (PgdA/CDA1 family)